MAKATDFDPRVLKLFDGYVQGTISRRQFIDRKLPGVVVVHENRGLIPYVEHFNTHLKNDTA